jgi:hypothetical protein
MSRGRLSSASAFSWSIVLDRPALGQARALGFLAFAALDIGSETARAQRDRSSVCGSVPRSLGSLARSAFLAGRILIGRKLAGEVAFRIVRAADKCAVFAELQRQVAGRRISGRCAGWSRPRGGNTSGASSSLSASSTWETRSSLVSSICAGTRPEIAQHVLPGKLAGRDPVELFLEIGREAEFDIALEEILQEGDHQPALGSGISRRLSMTTYSRSRSVASVEANRSTDGRCRALPSS